MTQKKRKTLKQRVAQTLLNWLGWKALIPDSRPPKSVICVAPHTSNLDFIIGKLYHNYTGVGSHFMMKKEWFVFPLGYIFRAMGGIPIDRKQKTSLVDQVAETIQKADSFHLGVTPEGTRSNVSKWKTGFYYMALKAGVPIELAKIDYGRKEVGIFELFHLTGNAEEDIAYIRSRYTRDMARVPEYFCEG
ncbi:MAG: lysophospholipid acyltransferase family protein [Porphyromonas sp.]|nr:lysophospholipid acyltransferase family protein [Porphyromonas sp.]